MTIKECFKSTKEIIKIHKRRSRLIKIRKLLLDEVKDTLDNGTYQICDIDLFSIDTMVGEYGEALNKEYYELIQKYNIKG